MQAEAFRFESSFEHSPKPSKHKFKTVLNNSKLSDLLKNLKIPIKKVAIELNQEIIDKKRSNNIKLKENGNFTRGNLALTQILRVLQDIFLNFCGKILHFNTFCN